MCLSYFFLTPRLALRAGSVINHQNSFPLKDDSCRSGPDKGFPPFRHQKLQIRPSSATSISCPIVMLCTIIRFGPTKPLHRSLRSSLQSVQAKPIRSSFHKGRTSRRDDGFELSWKKTNHQQCPENGSQLSFSTSSGYIYVVVRAALSSKIRNRCSSR